MALSKFKKMLVDDEYPDAENSVIRFYVNN